MKPDCIIWPTTKKGNEYIRINRDGKSISAHKWIYEGMKGPVPKGMELHHTCGNKRCINVEHLMPMTHREHKRQHAVAEAERQIERLRSILPPH